MSYEKEVIVFENIELPAQVSSKAETPWVDVKDDEFVTVFFKFISGDTNSFMTKKALLSTDDELVTIPIASDSSASSSTQSASLTIDKFWFADKVKGQLFRNSSGTDSTIFNIYIIKGKRGSNDKIHLTGTANITIDQI